MYLEDIFEMNGKLKVLKSEKNLSTDTIYNFEGYIINDEGEKYYLITSDNILTLVCECDVEILRIYDCYEDFEDDCYDDFECDNSRDGLITDIYDDWELLNLD